MNLWPPQKNKIGFSSGVLRLAYGLTGENLKI